MRLGMLRLLRVRQAFRRVLSSVVNNENPTGNESYIDSLAKTLGLTSASAEKLRCNSINKAVLLHCDSIRLQTELNLSFLDTVKIEIWKTEEMERKRAAEETRLKEERAGEETRLKEERAAEETRLKEERAAKKALRVKTFHLFDSREKKLKQYSVGDGSDFNCLLTRLHTPGLSEFEDDKISDVVVSSYDLGLTSGKVYVLASEAIDKVEILRRELRSVVRSRADFCCVDILKKVFGRDVVFLAHDVRLTGDKGEKMGDVDSFFRLDDSTFIFHLERKTTVNRSSSGELKGQISNTAGALRVAVKDPVFRKKYNISHSTPAVKSLLFCQAGDASVLREFLQDGVIVIQDGTEFQVPLQMKMEPGGQ